MIENYEIETEPRQTLFTRLRDNAYFIFGILGLFYVIEVIDSILDGRIERLGILPREATGLIGIPLAPFIHGPWTHLFANTLPFIVLGGLVIVSSNRERFIGVSCIIALVAGLGTWTFGTPGYHIGASSLIFGYLGFLLWRAWLGRNILWTIIALLSGVLYGGLIMTLVKSQDGISWTGHAFGLLGGVIAAFVFTPKAKTQSLPDL